MGDYIGKTDIERRYEKLLRGEKGKSYNIVDAYGRYQGQFKDGEMDIEPVRGSTLTLSIDHKLQKLAEELMVGKVGSVVAIEPSTGEILAMVSSPTFNPDTLIGSNRSRNYGTLVNNPRQPLFNRSIKAAYPPGSTFKMAMGLIALQEGVTNETEKFYCHGGFRVKGLRVGCHQHYSPLALEFALQTSCNAYFCEVFRRVIQNKKYLSVQVALDKWAEYLHSFGFGERLEIDVDGEATGFVPTSSFYDRAYNGRWNSLSVISLAIGQAELSITPLQLANFAAILANRGYYFTPHILKKIDGIPNVDNKYTIKHHTMIDQKYFSPVVEAMWKSVNLEGTGALARVEGLDICGKTGTAQNSRGDDHSTFIAFAPKDNPKIAVSAYVEHGRWGAAAALPIVSLMIEQYMNDTITRPWLVENMKKLSLNYPQYDKKKQLPKQ
ncbi:MAG: penicillin-binding transpeptidase domain-containing protein, partial [Rikenellaceae bacterium]